MKTAFLLFGLAGACVSGQTSETQYPLCGRDGAPACGNIGQVGRDNAPSTTNIARATLSQQHAATVGSATGFVTTAADTTRRMVPVLTRVLVGASSEIQRVSPLHRPLVDHREDVACGNVMTKSGRSRRCKHSQGVVTEIELDESGEPTGDVTTYNSTP